MFFFFHNDHKNTSQNIDLSSLNHPVYNYKVHKLHVANTLLPFTPCKYEFETVSEHCSIFHLTKCCTFALIPQVSSFFPYFKHLHFIITDGTQLNTDTGTHTHTQLWGGLCSHVCNELSGKSVILVERC